MTDPILNAIRFANREEHAGAAFTLDIQLAHGEWLRTVGVTDTPANGADSLEDYRLTGDGADSIEGYRLVGDGDGADLFVNPALVAQVVVQW